MKNILLILSFIISTVAVAQKHNIVNASIALRNAKKATGDEVGVILSEAMQYIDEAYNTESTANDPKMWNYRAPIYLEIALKKPELDNLAIIKATDAHIKCLQKGKKDRIIVKKWTSKEDILAGLIQCGYKLFNVAIDKYNEGDYKTSLAYYDKIFEIVPYDEEDQLKRGNITKETILYNSFFSSNKMKDDVKSKELLQNLIDINFNEPAIYIHISDIYKRENNIEETIKYLSLGREMFEDDQSLINTELNLYIELGRTSELLKKLGEAIELDTENSLLYFNRGTIYDQQGQVENAESDYLKSIELDPSSFGSNYNLGALFFNKAVELNNSANSTSDDKKYKSLKKQADVYFNKGLPYLEEAHLLNPKDKNTLLSLKQLYYMKGDYKKSDEVKKILEKTKN
ncbi:MAG: tetratricopeptide repeat protein [Flavobacteriales bacterium]|jgi:tetratricopeptide (TPR) repeat protein|nr:tetratricopeptide repeat protein [Flavobacteriales bacterium]